MWGRAGENPIAGGAVGPGGRFMGKWGGEEQRVMGLCWGYGALLGLWGFVGVMGLWGGGVMGPCQGLLGGFVGVPGLWGFVRVLWGYGALRRCGVWGRGALSGWWGFVGVSYGAFWGLRGFVGVMGC